MELIFNRQAAWALVAALGAALAGCGERSASSGDFYPVKGKVTLSDGKPLAGVNVVFLGPYSAVAHTEGDGTFAVKGEKEGLPEGEYRVRLEATGSAGKKAAPRFPSRYLDEDASGLTARVTPSGPNDLDFKLTRGDAGGTPTGSTARVTH